MRFVNLLITQAINDRASDIHIEPGEHQLTVRFRIDGVLHEMQKADRSIQDGVISRLKIMSSIDIAERRRPQDGRLSITHEGRQIDLRVATLPTVWGEKIVMRILDNIGPDDVDDATCGCRRRTTSASATRSPRPHGMMLVDRPDRLGQVDDALHGAARGRQPADQRHHGRRPGGVPHRGHQPGAGQQRAPGLTFATALRSILRSDPDVVLVGEIRDDETAIISIEAALTGHLVLSTLHTNDAPSALTRLTEIGAEPFLVATALTAVVAQRLARRLCMRCREPLRRVAPRCCTSLGFPHDPDDLPTDLPRRRLHGVLEHRLPRSRRAARGHDRDARRSSSSS